MKTNRKTHLAKAVGLLLVFALTISTVGVHGKVAEAKTSTKLKKACKAAVKKTGNAKKLNPDFNSSDPSYCNPLEDKHRTKISSLYCMQGNSVYQICVLKAKTTKYAKKIYKDFARYKKIMYLGKSDYTKEEGKILGNAIYGRKGKYVWYIAMSTKKKNKAGEAALKKSLKI